MAKILSISYNQALLMTRQLLLEQMGHTVYSAEGFSQAYKLCDSQGGQFDLIVLGHSIPHDDKAAIIQHCAKTTTCPVMALLRPGEVPPPKVAKTVDPSDPQAFMAAIEEIVSSNTKKR